MFKELLQKIIENCEGAAAGCVMGFDGIAVDVLTAPAAPGDVDVQTLGMEFSFVLTQIRKAAEVLEIGGLDEVVIRSEKLTFVVRMLSPEYFVGLVVLPTGNLGKGRFLVRKTVPELRAQLQ